MKKINIIKKTLIIIPFLLMAVFCVSKHDIVFSQTATREELQAELDDVEKQIAEYTKQLAATTGQKDTLTKKINQLRINQNKLNAQIKETTLKINKLDKTITVTEQDLQKVITKEMELKADISTALRAMNEKEENFILSLLSASGLSDAFVEIQNFGNMSAELQGLVTKARANQKKITEKKSVLEDQKDDATKLLQIKSIQKNELTGTLGEQNNLLTKTKGLEANYKSQLEDRKKRAAEIRSRIYELFNTGTQVNFGQAVEIAKWTANLTGIRPAFILAVLTQESNLGKNVGTCNRVGDPEEKSWKVIMKPTRDQEPFLQITKELGLDPDTTPVSCPMKDKNGKQVGWGGAMGPAQFIPSTWMGYKNKVAATTGKNTANPWDIRDAFVASALKLRADGADGTEDNEWKAAMKYFAGSVNLTYRFYGDNVMARAKKYQADIDELAN